VSIGIISPFRAQVEQLKISVSKVLSEHMMEKHQIEIGTAHTFQGDERDIMLISWAYAQNSYPQSLIFLQKPNLFNVAITRARYKTINFISKNPRELPEGILRSYFGFIEEYENRYALINSDDFDENIYKNSFEKEVADTFRSLGHKVDCGEDIAGLSVDLLVDDKFVIECDGVEDKSPSKVSNMKKQAIIERTGLKVSRITAREWNLSSKACVDRVINSNI
jgi:very-short-patch-repair endonuclease